MLLRAARAVPNAYACTIALTIVPRTPGYSPPPSSPIFAQVRREAPPPPRHCRRARASNIVYVGRVVYLDTKRLVSKWLAPRSVRSILEVASSIPAQRASAFLFSSSH